MKLLVFSHSCATPVNQALYADVRRQTGWDITLVVPSNWRDEFGRRCVPARWPAFDGELLALPVWKSGDIILHAYRAAVGRLIRRVKPDAVYVNHEPYAVATAQVFWANGGRRPIGFYSCQNILKRYPPPFRWTEAGVLGGSAFAFPISASVEDVLRKKHYAGACTVLPLAIDTTLYRPHADKSAARRALLHDVDDGAPLIGYVGRLVPEKGLLTLIAALATLRGAAWRLVLIGTGALEAGLRRAAEGAGVADRVTFVGFIPHADMPRVFSALDVLVLPSETQSNWREQFGRVLLEALACGVPLVGSDSGEIPTLIRDTGGGIVFAERDAAALAAALRALIDDAPLRHALAAAGRAETIARYGTARVATAFAGTIEAAVARHRA